MKTSEEIEAEFRKEFQALVDKYKAEVEIKDYWQGYAELGQDVQCKIYIGAIYNENFETIRDCCEFELGNYHVPAST